MKYSERSKIGLQHYHYRPVTNWIYSQPYNWEFTPWSYSERLFHFLENFLEAVRVKLYLHLKPVAIKCLMNHFIRKIQLKYRLSFVTAEPEELSWSIKQEKARLTRKKSEKKMTSRSVKFEDLEPSLQSKVLQELKGLKTEQGENIIPLEK